MHPPNTILSCYAIPFYFKPTEVDDTDDGTDIHNCIRMSRPTSGKTNPLGLDVERRTRHSPKSPHRKNASSTGSTTAMFKRHGKFY